MEKKVKLLLMHNAIPEYRIPWFRYLNRHCDVDFVFTNYQITKKLYHFDTDYNKLEGMNYVILGKDHLFLCDVFQLLKTIENYDFVEFPPVDSPKEFFVSSLTLLLCKMRGIKTGYFWEKWEAPKNKQPIKRKIVNFITNVIPGIIYHRVDLIFAGSTSSKKYFEQHGVKSDKISVIPDASETPMCTYENLRDKYSIPEGKKVILFFGRLLVQKGLHYLIQAVGNLENKDEYFLVIAGDGENREYCERLIKELKIKNVAMCGWVNPDYRLNFFSQCDIFVFPGTFYEGRVDVWGLTLVEAIQNKKIVISTNAVGSAIDLIKNGTNGFILDATNEYSLAESIADAISKCDDKLQQSTIAYDEFLSQKYCFSNMGKTYLDLIEKELGFSKEE